MNTVRPCGCKGVRTCLKCEQEYNIRKPALGERLRGLEPWSYCVLCGRLFQGWDVAQVRSQHPDHKGHEGIRFAGILVQENFLSEAEGSRLMGQLDDMPWTISQSGRRKQNFGPKTNFKKRKLQTGSFCGFPDFTEFIQRRLSTEVDLLKGFQTIEQCSLEYDPTKGASIDPHVDDCWIWGERVVTVNCLGDSVLTLTLFEEAVHTQMTTTKYNLDLVASYEEHLLIPLANNDELASFRNRVIRVPMPNLSLIVMYGPARYQFEHSVLREDIKERRVCLAYREFTPMYLDGGRFHNDSLAVIEKAKIFWKPDNAEQPLIDVK